MMARYKTGGEWHTIQRQRVHDFYDTKESTVTIEMADVLDTRTNRTYQGGSRRVLRDGKPVRGKGGTVPFYGEMAWCQAENLADRIVWDIQREHRSEFEAVRSHWVQSIAYDNEREKQ